MNASKELTLIDPGILPASLVKRLVDVGGGAVALILSRPNAELEKHICSVPIFRYPSADNSSVSSLPSDRDPFEIWSHVVNDHQTFLFFDRYHKNIESNTMRLSYMVRYCLAAQIFLEELRPTNLIYMAAPHNVTTWIFARVAEELGVNILYFNHSSLPWRYFLLKGLTRHPTIVAPKIPETHNVDERLWNAYAAEKRGTRTEALPLYESARLEKNQGRYLNLWQDVRRSWRRPDLIVSKFINYFVYQRLAQAPIAHDPYVAFFLNYQPERTTLPEGYGFAQQMAAVILLSKALPTGTILYVKEHPSTFTNRCDWKQRSPKWYRTISSLPNVQLLPIETDQYTLIDKCIAVATITGTVGFEALIRGKPVVVFGAGPLQELQSSCFHRFSNLQALRAFLQSVSRVDCQSHELDRYVQELCAITFSGAKKDDSLLHVKMNSRAVRFQAIEEGIMAVLEES